MRKFAFACGVVLLSVSTLTACKVSTRELNPLERYVVPKAVLPRTVNVNFCTDPAVPEKFAVKTVIILDHSGSNKLNYKMDSSGYPIITNNKLDVDPKYATDYDGKLRYGDLATPGSLLHFLNNLPANDPNDPQRFFAMVNFSTGASQYPSSGRFTSDIPDFARQVTSDARGGDPNNAAGVPQDTGATSYLSALTTAYNIINSDIQDAKNCAAMSPDAPPTTTCRVPGQAVASAYVVVMASDGAPVITFSGVNSSNVVIGQLNFVKEDSSTILGKVQAMTALTSNKKFVAGVNLFTVYYYNTTNNEDKTASDLLKEMARVGNGLFYPALTGSRIDYTRFQPPARMIKYLLADLFVTNTSGTFGPDGLFTKDTDGDGLPDDLELAWGSSPTLSDSDGNGVSDMVEYQLKNGAACTIKNGSGRCVDAAVDYRANNGPCAGVAFSGGKYKVSDPSGLNDCEKVLLSDTGGINNPDSNGDGVPDWLAFRNGVPFQLNSPPAYLTTLSDGYTQYQKVKLSLPVNVPLNQVLNWKPTNYALTQVSNTAVQACYKLAVTDMPTISDTDNIRVELIERSELLQDRYLYRSAQKGFVPGQTTLLFNDWNDPIEKAASTWKVWP